MNADKMFEKLGYEKVYFSNNPFVATAYEKDNDNVIVFRNDKTFKKQGKYDSMCDSVTMQELQVINKKCEELGWI